MKLPFIPRFFMHVLPLCLTLCAAQAQTSTFDTNDEGWSVVSFSNLTTDNFGIVGSYTAIYNSTGGNPGGFISNNDPDGGDATFAAPASFLGDRSAAIGTSFSYDLMHSGTNNYNATDLIFEGNGMRLLWEASPDLAPTTTWLNVSVTLAPSAQWHLNTHNGTQATMADFQSVFANLSGIFIRGEYTNGGESDGIDNVNFVPEPATTSLLALTFGAGALLWRKRRLR
jgi:hypothetical protein